MNLSHDDTPLKQSGKDILCISSMPYEGMWTRKQRFMTMLANRGHRVLYVEPAMPMFTKEGDSGHFRSSLRKVTDNLWVLKPVGLLPAARFGIVKKLNLNLFARAVRSAMRKHDLHAPIVFTYFPVLNFSTPFMDLWPHLGGSLLIYECVDEISETPGSGSNPQIIAAIKQWDQELVKRADLVSVTAQGLYETRRVANENVLLSPNGVDVSHFSKALRPETTIPEDLAKIPTPRIGFVGGISDWIDLALIRKVALAYPQYQIVLVGPFKRGMGATDLDGLKNVHLLGKKPLAELPGYLKGFRCGLNPFKDIPLSKTVNPLKVYEYLAAGLPVVSVSMPEVEKLRGVVRIASSADDFVKGVGECVDGTFVRDAEKLNAVLRNHDWNTIFSVLSARIDDAVKRRGLARG